MHHHDSPADRATGFPQDPLFEDLQRSRDGDVDRTLSAKLGLQHHRVGSAPFALGDGPTHILWGDARWVALVQTRGELKPKPGVHHAGLTLHGPLGWVHLDLPAWDHVEEVALVGTYDGGVVLAAPGQGSARLIDQWNQLAIFGERQDACEVPALFPVDLGQTREAHVGGGLG